MEMIQSIMTNSQTEIKRTRKKSNYCKVSNEARQKLIELVYLKEYLLKDAAKALNINYSTAKTILRIFRLEKRVEKKNADEDKDLKLYINDYISREHNIQEDLEVSPKKRIELVAHSDSNSTRCTNFKFMIKDEDEKEENNLSDRTLSEANDEKSASIETEEKQININENLKQNIKLTKSKNRSLPSSKDLNQLLNAKKSKFVAPRRINSSIDASFNTFDQNNNKINFNESSNNILAGPALTAVIEDFHRTFKSLASTVENCYGMIKSNQMMINNLITLTGGLSNSNTQNDQQNVNINNQIDNNLSTEQVNEILIKYIINKNLIDNQQVINY